MREILKYMIPLVGKYNKSVIVCIKCDYSYIQNLKHGSHFDNIIGFANSEYGLMAVWECPVCFEKYYYHADDHIKYFLESIESKTNKHWRETL